MFTGIIEEVGTILAGSPGQLTVGAESVRADLKLGESIAVDGVDLTVAALGDGSFSTNVMAETYRRSTLKGLVPGRRVNLERALLSTTRLSGHLVRGVIEGTARIEERRREGDDLLYRFVVGPDLLRAIVVKGPVAVDGASFTVIDRDAVSFTVSIVTYSQTHTTIAERDVGDLVNVETDLLARYVEAAVEARLGHLDQSP